MGVKLGVLAIALGAAVTGRVPSGFMLCIHQDGRKVVEPFVESCCDEAPSSCPDEECRDLPLTLAADEAVSAIEAVDPGPVSSDVKVDPDTELAPDPFAARPDSGFLDPPRCPAASFLRTVVLRL